MTITKEMMYKFNFLVSMFTLMSFDMVMPLVTLLIYMNTNGFLGWSFHEVMLFMGIFMMINALDRMFFQKVDWSLSYDVRTGEFDRYLLFPVNTLAYISFTNFGMEHIGDFVLGAVLLVYSIIKMALPLSFFNVVLFLGYIALAIIFVFSLAVIKYSIIVSSVKIGRLGEFFRVIKQYGQYPVDIYNSFFSSVFRYVLPLAVLAYYPSKALLEGLHTNMHILALIVLAIFLMALSFWRISLKNYSSAGG